MKVKDKVTGNTVESLDKFVTDSWKGKPDRYVEVTEKPKDEKPPKDPKPEKPKDEKPKDEKPAAPSDEKPADAGSDKTEEANK